MAETNTLACKDYVTSTGYTTITTTCVIFYTYDPLNRLTGASYSTGESFEYAYDAVGNRTAFTQTTSLAQTTVTTYTYDAANRLTSIQQPASSIQYAWDARGNLTSDGTFTYEYNAAGRLVRAASVTSTLVYTYNASGLRVAQSVQSAPESVDSFAWDWASGVPEMLRQGDTLYLVGHETLGKWDGSQWAYHLPDALGSVRQATDATGAVVRAREWSPYGVELGSAQPGLGYTGEWWDAEVGLQYLRARWYDAEVGRFTGPDMIAPDFTNPQSVNQYGYALGNPLRYTDPSGNIPFCAFYGDFVCSYVWPDSGPSWLNRVSAALSVRLQFTSDRLSWLLHCATGHCEEMDYCPSDTTQQAMGIVRDWFFETGAETQYFGPDEPVTQELMYDFGVERFRQEWALASYRLPYPTDEDDANLINGNWWWHYDIDESGGRGGIVWAFVCENAELAVSLTGLGSMTPQGPVDAVGGVLGSYRIRVEEKGFGMAKFIVYNETGWASGTRVGNLGSLIQNRPRDKWGPGGTIKQHFHWYEPIPI